MNNEMNVKTKIYTKSLADSYRLTAGEMNSIKYLFEREDTLTKYTELIPELIYTTLEELKVGYQEIKIFSTNVDPDPVAVGCSMRTFMLYDRHLAKGVTWKKIGYKEYENIPVEKYIELKDMITGYNPQGESFDLIAQWGREIDPIEAITKKARDMYMLKEGNRLQEDMIRAKHALELLDIEANKKFITTSTVLSF